MFELLAAEPTLFVSLAAVFGLMLGSFLNVVIHRLPRMMQQDWREQCAWLEGKLPEDAKPPYNLVVPRSACPACQHQIAWYENLPVVSWLVLRGRCSACGASISLRYPLVELFTSLLFAAAAWHFGFGIQVVFVCGLLATLVALSFIDLDTQLLPDNLTLPLAWVGLLANLNGMFCTLEEAVIGGVAGYLALWSVYHLFKWLTGKEGMGFGDFKLLASLGAWLGWKMLLPIILAASFAGAIIGIAMIVFAGRDRAQPMPFGPWLAFGGLISVFWGQTLLQFWLG